MLKNEHFIKNKEITLHVIETNPQKNTTLVIVPGMMNDAEQLYEILGENLNYHCFFISIRGRGKSDKPKGKMSFEEQASDIKVVVNALKLDKFHLFGHSVGAAFSTAYAVENPTTIRSLILGDYKPKYLQLSQSWRDNILAQIEHYSTAEQVVNDLYEQSKTVDLKPLLEKQSFRKLLIRSSQPDSLLSLDVAQKLVKDLPNSQLKTIDESGHILFYPNKKQFLDILEEFIGR